MKKTILLTISTLLVALLSSHNAFTQPIYTSGHGDIGVGYDSTDGFEPHWHLGTGAVVDGSPLADEEEYEADELIARTSATLSSPTGLSNIIGLADGSTIYAAGSSTYQPNLGFSAEELIAGDWTGNITVSLTGWTLPSGAHFALYSTNLAGTTVVDRIFSTFNPGNTDLANSLPLTPGDHLHFQWGFTDVGTYDLEFTWSGTHVVDGFQTASETFTFNVIPEPSTWAMLALGLALVVVRGLRLRTASVVRE